MNKRFKTTVIVFGLAVLAAGCSARAQQGATVPSPTIDVGKSDPAPLLDEQLGGLTTVAHHKTTTTIRDITDPEHPIEVARWEGNLLGGCGVRNLMQLAMAGYNTSMGAATGAANSLGQRCAGVNEHGDQKVSQYYTQFAQIVIGSGNAGDCTGAGTPFTCCTGSGTGCAISYLDNLTFSEGQPNGTTANLSTIWNSIAGTTPANTAYLTPLDAPPDLYWDGANLMGIRFLATAGTSTANIKWCEYAVRSGPALTFIGGSVITGVGPAAATSNGLSPGWQLNHALISPCITKTSGMIWQIEVQILLS